MPISVLGVVFLLVIGVVVPHMAIRSDRLLREGLKPPPARSILLGSIVSQLVLAAMALGVAAADGLVLFPRPAFALEHALGALVLLACALATLPLRWRTRKPEDMRRIAMLLPRTAGDLPLWFCVSLAAGVCEEIVYRGVMFQLLDRVFTPWGWAWWPAAMLASLAFSAAHMMQGRSAALIVLAFSMAFHALVRLTDNLYWAMGVHFAYDLLAGVVLWRLFQRSPQEFGLPGAETEVPGGAKTGDGA